MAAPSVPQGKSMPKDALVIMSILKDMGISEYEPNVVTQLLEFTYRYVTTTLEDARVYAQHAGKKAMDTEDVQLAVQMQLDKNFTTPPPRDLLMEVARAKNTTPLPMIKPHCGIRLPPDRYCMTACNYELRSNKKPSQAAKPATVFSTTPQTKPVVKRSIPMVARTQSMTAPKPVIKFTPAGGMADSSHWKPVNAPVVQTVMEIDEPPATMIKRKHPDDD